MKRSRPVALALAGPFVWVTACSTYTRVQPNEVSDHGKVRVTTTDGARQTVWNPRLEADTIRAHERRASDRRYYDPIVVMPLDDVVSLEAVGTDEVGTVLTATGVFVGSLVIVFAVACALSSEQDYLCF